MLSFILTSVACFLIFFFSSISVVTECSTGVLLGKIQKAIEF